MRRLWNHLNSKLFYKMLIIYSLLTVIPLALVTGLFYYRSMRYPLLMFLNLSFKDANQFNLHGWTVTFPFTRVNYKDAVRHQLRTAVRRLCDCFDSADILFIFASKQFAEGLAGSAMKM